MGCKCPMTDEAIKKYNLTDSQIDYFCKAGCSVICDKLFAEWIKKKGQADKKCKIKRILAK